MGWIVAETIALPAGVTLHALGDTDSTNADAKLLAGEGAPHLTLVTARRQLAGRGRHGRFWVSPEGNAYWSLLLRPQSDWPAPGTLPFVAALAVRDALAQVTGAPGRLALKWPNDILLDGKKVCGILIEASGNQPAGAAPWIVVGIGINVAHFPSDARYPATSLHAAGFAGATREAAIAALTACFLRRLDRWIGGGYGALKDDLLVAMTGIGQAITVRRTDNAADDLTGLFEGLDGEGRLMLRTAAGTRLITVGDVFLL